MCFDAALLSIILQSLIRLAQCSLPLAATGSSWMTERWKFSLIFPRLGQIYSTRKKILVNPVHEAALSCWTLSSRCHSCSGLTRRTSLSFCRCFPLYLPLFTKLPLEYRFLHRLTIPGVGSWWKRGWGVAESRAACGSCWSLITVASWARLLGGFVKMFGPSKPPPAPLGWMH